MQNAYNKLVRKRTPVVIEEENLKIGDTCECPGGIGARFIQPCILLLLQQKDSYGYEIIENLNRMRAPSEPSAVYKSLRRLENDGFVKSKWDTTDSGPAKRYYTLTPEGEDLLASWVTSLKQNKEILEQFLRAYSNQNKLSARTITSRR